LINSHYHLLSLDSGHAILIYLDCSQRSPRPYPSTNIQPTFGRST
jgi:hypothetical protein